MSVNEIAAFGASTLAPGASAASNRADRQLQGAFSAVLEAAGRDGYASAPKLASGEAVAESAQKALDEWFGVERNGRYATHESPEVLRQAFGQIVARAINEGGYQDPSGFLASLTPEELATLQTVNALAQPIDVAGLTEEGALNLLLPPAAQVDLDHDGITQSGIGRGIRFPNSDTPADVVGAWDAVTAGMSWGERAAYELRMMMPIVTANLVTDASGGSAHLQQPGEEGYSNPMARDDYSYRDAVRQQIEGLDFSKPWITQQQYDQQMAFWRQFGEELDARGAV